jgi:NADP-dependent 3-hydroxy acid dehydrogenase YdfG
MTKYILRIDIELTRGLKCNQVLPVMREQNSGIIINVSSVGGRIGLPVLSVYHSTKFALEGSSEFQVCIGRLKRMK